MPTHFPLWEFKMFIIAFQILWNQSESSPDSFEIQAWFVTSKTEEQTSTSENCRFSYAFKIPKNSIQKLKLQFEQELVNILIHKHCFTLEWGYVYQISNHSSQNLYIHLNIHLK